MGAAKAGQIDLDEPVNEQMSSWQLPRSSFDLRGVTLRRILSHTAGLSVHGFPQFRASEKQPDLIGFLNGKRYSYGPVKVIQRPGESYRYSSGVRRRAHRCSTRSWESYPR